jgi:antitoxin HicB
MTSPKAVPKISFGALRRAAGSYAFRVMHGTLLQAIEDFAVDEKRTFTVVLEPEAEGGFTVRVPAFPEIITYGKDEREALDRAEDAIRLVIADCTARGEPVPTGEPPRIREITVTLAA